MNGRWFETTGLERDALIADSWRSVVHPDDVPVIDRVWQYSSGTGKPFECEYRIHDASSGTWRWHLGRMLPELAEGRVVRWYGTATDIHDRRIAEDALREADRRKSDFLAILSHELRNPLGPARNAVAYLDRVAPPDEAQARARSVISRQVAHMARLVDDQSTSIASRRCWLP